LGEPAHHRVVLEEVGHGLERAEVVDRDEVEVGALLLRGPEEVSPDAAEAVDANADGHGRLSTSWSLIIRYGYPTTRTPTPTNTPSPERSEHRGEQVGVVGEAVRAVDVGLDHLGIP